ncbi:MAG: UDP-N-acetylmuramoyl-L-alanine--D-glutamate ligase [Lentisphaeria bacterium]|nr:UDP-N-acetylmuramoyl-L-alanine--D-glutamate ligase [Lentisphaeria bacterium]
MKKKLVILGGGVSGRAAFDLGTKLGYDAIVINDNDASLLPESDLIVASPGVHPLKSHLYRQAVKEGRAMTGEMAFGAAQLGDIPILAVTGTNGKTTTTELTCHLLNALGVKTVACGNIGLPVSAVANAADASVEAVVIEVSSFQLELAENFAPTAAVLLNLKSDHEERYPGGFEEYAAVKKSIFKNVPTERRFYGINSFSIKGRAVVSENALVYDGRILVDKLDETGFAAPHNQENLAAATQLVMSIIPQNELDIPRFAQAVRSFKFGRHRIEFVAQKNGVKFYNDSKATNPSAVTSAVNALKGQGGKIVLMLGGSDKGMDFSELRLLENELRCAVLFGASGENIGKVFSDDLKKYSAGMDLKKAVELAFNAAEQGDIVLLSPACASFDMFKGYDDRGNQFCELVNSL